MPLSDPIHPVRRLLLGTCLTLAACATSQAVPPLAGSEWRLSHINDDAVLAHPFWQHGGVVFHAQLLHFLKNVAAIGGLLLLALYAVYGLHVVSFTMGMPLAGRLERLMLLYVLPALLAFLLFTSLRAWRRQHHKRESP